MIPHKLGSLFNFLKNTESELKELERKIADAIINEKEYEELINEYKELKQEYDKWINKTVYEKEN